MFTKEQHKKAIKIQKKLSMKDSLDFKQQKYFDKLIEKIIDYECYIADKEISKLKLQKTKKL